MKTKSLIKKTYLTFLLKTILRKIKIDDNVYFIRRSVNTVKAILFYFPFYEFMHYGDHLFFEPLIRFLIENGYKVTICPVESMEFYFKSCGYSTISKNQINWSSYDLVISRVEMYDKLKNLPNNILMLKTAYTQIKNPLTYDMINKVAKFLKVEPQDMGCYKPIKYIPDELSEILAKLKLYDYDNYVIFNPYIDSGNYSLKKETKAKLTSFLESFLKNNPGTQVIFSGSKKDFANDHNRYNFHYIDIRGETSINDVFALMQSDCVKAYIGFDGLFLHISFMYDKESFILVRPSTIYFWKDNLDKLLIPFFSLDKINLTLIQ